VKRKKIVFTVLCVVQLRAGPTCPVTPVPYCVLYLLIVLWHITSQTQLNMAAVNVC